MDLGWTSKKKFALGVLGPSLTAHLSTALLGWWYHTHNDIKILQKKTDRNATKADGIHRQSGFWVLLSLILAVPATFTGVV